MNNLFSRSTLQVVGAGALGGFLGFLLGESMSRGMSPDRALTDVIVSTMVWTAIIAFAMGPCILVGENYISLRGKWHRDLIKGLITFPFVGLFSGLGAQLFYMGGMSVAQNNSAAQILARALGWMLLGIGLGIGMGAVRSDFKAALRGGFGGAAGGFLGGLCFNYLANLGDGGTDVLSRCFGLVVLGAAIAFCVRFAEQSLKTAWLLGISTGPYEGKESPLDKARVSVGRSDSADLSLYRDETVPDLLGELVFQNGGWLWQGQSVEIDGQQQAYSPLRNGSILQFGTYRFRFMSRSEQSLNLVASTPQNVPPIASPNVVAAPAQYSGPIVLNPQVNRFLPLELSGTSHSLGRALDNDLVVSEASVSSSHAHLFLERGAWNLKDVGSTNGTFVNENRLGEGPIKLRIGDRVRFGSAEFEVAPL